MPISVPKELEAVQAIVARSLDLIGARFDEQLVCDLAPVSELCAHVERYRGKMLRPTLVVASGLAAHPRATDGIGPDLLTDDHVVLGAVVEMVHMATLVHDDVLDEAELRRGAPTVGRLRGNEAAVILGDYLIAAAFHLCSQLDSQRASLLVGRASMTVAEGELLQLHNRENFSIDERTCLEILERKTAALISIACELGAWASGGSDGACRGLGLYGREIGVAFQIQDDVLDLTGEEGVVGKSVGRDLAKGKLTLPLIHHLASVDTEARGRSLRLIEAIGRSVSPDGGEGAALREAIEASGSVDHARRVARAHVDRARGRLEVLADTPARALLAAMAEAVVERRQ
jgi:octaprenyl-diphosphate synthase